MQTVRFFLINMFEYVEGPCTMRSKLRISMCWGWGRAGAGATRASVQREQG